MRARGGGERRARIETAMFAEAWLLAPAVAPATSRGPDIDLAALARGRVARLLFQEGKCYHCFVVAKIATAACRRCLLSVLLRACSRARGRTGAKRAHVHLPRRIL